MVNAAWNTAQGRFRVWHESLSSAREDEATALSLDGLEILTDRPLPMGTRVFLELGPDVDTRIGMDAEVDQVQDSPMGVMRLRFTDVSDAARTHLQQLLDELGPMQSVMEGLQSSLPPDATSPLTDASTSLTPEALDAMLDMPTPGALPSVESVPPASVEEVPALAPLDLAPLSADAPLPVDETPPHEVPTADPELLAKPAEEPLLVDNAWDSLPATPAPDGAPAPAPAPVVPMGLDSLWQTAPDVTAAAAPAPLPDWAPQPEEHAAPAPITMDESPVPPSVDTAPPEQSHAPVGEQWFDAPGSAEEAPPASTAIELPPSSPDDFELAPLAEEPPAPPPAPVAAELVDFSEQITAPGGHRVPTKIIEEVDAPRDPFAFEPPPAASMSPAVDEPMDLPAESPSLPAGFSFDDEPATPGPSPLDALPLPPLPEALAPQAAPAPLDDEAARDPLFHAWGDPVAAPGLATPEQPFPPTESAAGGDSFDFPFDENAAAQQAAPVVTEPAPAPEPPPEEPGIALLSDLNAPPPELDMRAFSPRPATPDAPPPELDMSAFAPQPALDMAAFAPRATPVPAPSDDVDFIDDLTSVPTPQASASPAPPLPVASVTPPPAVTPPAPVMQAPLPTPRPAPPPPAPPPSVVTQGLPPLPPLGGPMVAPPPVSSGLPDLPPLPSNPAAAFAAPSAAAPFGAPPSSPPPPSMPFGAPAAGAQGQEYDPDFDAELAGDAFPAPPVATPPPAAPQAPPAAAAPEQDPFAFERNVDVDFGSRGDMFQQPQGFFSDPNAAAGADLVGQGAVDLGLGAPRRAPSADPPLNSPDPMVRDPAFDTGQFNAVRGAVDPGAGTPFNTTDSTSGEFQLGTHAEMLMQHPENRFTQPGHEEHVPLVGGAILLEGEAPPQPAVRPPTQPPMMMPPPQQPLRPPTQPPQMMPPPQAARPPTYPPQQMMPPPAMIPPPARPQVDLDDIFGNVDLNAAAPPPQHDEPEDIPLLVGGTLLDAQHAPQPFTPPAPITRTPSFPPSLGTPPGAAPRAPSFPPAPPTQPAQPAPAQPGTQSTRDLIDSLFDED